LTGPNGTVYDGDWVDGYQNGLGKFAWSADDVNYGNCVYIGSFVDGSLQGEGNFEAGGSHSHRNIFVF
jgi:hypothetical protein